MLSTQSTALLEVGITRPSEGIGDIYKYLGVDIHQNGKWDNEVKKNVNE